MRALSFVPRGKIARWIVDYNPFYLLSAACMLFGVFALNDSLDWSPLPLRNLLRMILTLNVYEAVVIALATFLLSRGEKRHGVMLLIIEAFFLADVGFLNMEVFARDVRIGLIVNALVLAAAIVKVMFVLRAVKIPIFDPRFVFLVMQLAVLFAVPGLFAVIARPRDEHLPALAIYAGWWLAGALPVAYVMTVGSLNIFRRRWDGQRADADMIVSRVMLLLPMLSLLAHLCLANWIYKVQFYPVNVGPLLLGFAVLAGHADVHVTSLAARMRLQLALPIVALLLSGLQSGADVIFPIAQIDFTPLRVALVVAAIVYLDGLILHRHAYFACGAAMFLAAAGMGHSPASINDNSMQMARRSADGLRQLVPQTLRQWGVVSVGASFVLLALGAAISVLRRTPIEEPVRSDNA